PGEKMPRYGNSQLFRIMKIITVLLVATCVHLSAETRSQTVTLAAKNQPLGEVLEAIEEQTDLLVVFNDRFVDPASPVSLTTRNTPLRQALDQLLRPRKLDYYITEKTIVITPGSVDKRVPGAVTPAAPAQR